MIFKKDIRNYEVSIWTLQDSFITVLKQFGLENKERIQEPKMVLKDDGENTFSFSIPMYIFSNGEYKENPAWYTTRNGNIIANMRKIKVIFHKKTNLERIFEFIVLRVTEKHEGFSKICEVECENLAFHELGKQGYKISLSEEDLNYETEELNNSIDLNDSVEEIYIKNNINYWVNKVLAGTNWKYSIQMDWSIYDGIIDQYEEGATSYADLTEEQRETLNSNRAHLGLRRHDCIYEEDYATSWSTSQGTLIPAAIVSMKEKLRIIDSNESNRYNLLQSIAETFEVYTKYKYYYDDNYHIIGREVIFYNNFLDENNFIDLTYDYDTQSISRQLDATDIITKMYVKTLDDESYPGGLASIADTEANKTGEDYILNFDYLYNIKTISNEQYTAIKTFEKNIANLNNQIKPLDTEIIKLESDLLDVEIARDNALAIMKEAEENINFTTEQLKAITEDSNYNAVVKVIKTNPAFVFLSKKKNNEYLGKFGSQFSGIVQGTVKVYSDSTCTTEVNFGQQVKNDVVQSLTFDNLVGSSASNGYLYATFDYRPALEKEKLREDYQTLYNNKQTIYNDKLTKIEGTNPTKVDGDKEELGLINYIKVKKQQRQLLYEQKQTLIAEFENMMGPALREGNWQPEDEYVGYGDQYDENIQPSYESTPISTASGKLQFIWDKKLFDEEEKNYYEYGINQQKVYYPCINLTAINSNVFEKLKEEEFRNGLSFVYKNSNESNPYLLPQGVNCKFAFIQPTSGGNIIPVLMITNLYNEVNIINDTTAGRALTYLQSLTSYIAYVTDISVLLNTISVDNSTIFSVPSSAWVEQPHRYKIVYPRLEIQSDLLKTGANELLLNIYREKTNPTGQGTVYTYIKKLEEFTDYSIFSRDEKKYITIKPEVLFGGKIGEVKIKINYCLANTALQIYLDALKVAKENAYPKVSYTINQLFSPKLFYNTYDRLGQLAHINDAKLKFKNVMGYISEVELILDKPWEDNIVIQNYKNKFEDLFSTIVAQTEDMKKNASRIKVAANAFSANGLLTAEVTPESLLKSTRILNNLIKQNADVIAARAVSEAAKNKAILASTDVYKVMHGEVGLAFKGNKIDKVVLNQDNGLIIAGKSNGTNVFFQLNNSEMGFFKGIPGTFDAVNENNRPIPQLYYENGNLALSGNMYAASGWFGGDEGWIIGSNKLPTNNTIDLGGLLYSENGKAIFTSKGGGTNKTDPMIILTKTGFSLNEQDAVLLFDGNNLHISGTIISTEGNIGGWHIGSSYLGNNITKLNSTVGMASGKDDYEQSQKYSFWAGDTYSGTPLFYVTPAGALFSKSGSIGGWNITANSISKTATLENKEYNIYMSTDLYNENNNNPYNPVFCVKNITDKKYPFYVRSNGILHAEGAEISGALTATSLSTGGRTSTTAANGTYIDSNGAIYGGQNKFTVSKEGAVTATSITIGSTSNTYLTYDSANGLKVKGNITATSGTFTGIVNANDGEIGGWSINSNSISKSHTVGQDTYDIYMSTNVYTSGNQIPYNPVFCVKKNNTYPFYVRSNGALHAENAEISGKITASSGTVGGFTINPLTSSVNSATQYALVYNTISSNNYFVTSLLGLCASAGESGAVIWAGGVRNPQQLLLNGHERTTFTQQPNSYQSGDFYDGKYAIRGNTSYNSSDWLPQAPFRVTREGKLYATNAEISGKINATGGTIGGWDITTNSIRSSTTTSTNGTYSGWRHGLFKSESTGYALVIAAPLESYNLTDNSITYNNNLAPFRVTNAGKLYADGAVITGSTRIEGQTTIGGQTTINTSGNVTVAGGSIKFNAGGDKEEDPNFLSFLFQPNQGENTYRKITLVNKTTTSENTFEKSKITILPSEISMTQQSGNNEIAINFTEGNLTSVNSSSVIINGITEIRLIVGNNRIVIGQQNINLTGTVRYKDAEGNWKILS